MNETHLKEYTQEEKQDLRSLRNMPVHNYNLNYLIEDDIIQFDIKISPLLAACFIGKVEIINLILNNEEIDVNFESQPEGYTPLIVSCFKGYYEIVRILLDKNADVNKKNKLGQMPILFCFSRLEEDFYKYENKKICMMMIDLLLTKGADINIRIDKKSGYSILMKLSANENSEQDKKENSLEIIQFLIERGANLYLRGNDDKTVFDIIENSKIHDEILKVLTSTHQIIFFNTIHDSEPNETQNLNYNKKSLGTEQNILIEQNTFKLNCCEIF